MSRTPNSLNLADLQGIIERMYGEKDRRRGAEGTFLYLMEEIGELATALRSEPHEALEAEFADVLAWLATLANIRGVDLTAAVAKKYTGGCPGCGELVCQCDVAEKP